MTRDTHTTGSARQPGRRHPRPEAGRPSLFADFDQESVEDIDPQRIRLLSTLESQRGVRRRPHTRRLATGRTHPWLTRALMVAMGLGMLVMLLSFIQLLRRPPPSPPAAGQAEAMQAQAHAGTTARLAGVSATDAAEIIDMSPPAGGITPGEMPATQAPNHPSPNTVQPGTSLVSAVPQNLPPPSPPKTVAPPGTEPERIAKAAKPGAQRASANLNAGANTKREPMTSQEDVALVEAMLAHAGPRKAPPSPTLALQQCGTGTSAQTSVCRAKVCVQHPSLPACHTP